MATLAGLQAKRNNLKGVIQKRGGMDKASNYADRFNRITNQIQQMRPGQQQQGSVGNFKVGTDAASLNAQKANLEKRIAAKGGTAANYQARLDAVNKGIAGLTPAVDSQTSPSTDQTTGTGQIEPGVEGTGSETGGDWNSTIDSEKLINNKNLFPGVYDFVPGDFEGSPLYKFRQQQGETALKRRLAAQGLTGSNKDFEAHQDLNSQLNAEEADRLQQLAESRADRNERMYLDQLNRDERGIDRDYSQQMGVIDRLLGLDPSTMQGVENYGSNVEKEGQNRANTIRNSIIKLFSGGGGGGTGTPAPTLNSPFASGPDFSMIDSLVNSRRSNTNRDIGGIISSILSGLG